MKILYDRIEIKLTELLHHVDAARGGKLPGRWPGIRRAGSLLLRTGALWNAHLLAHPCPGRILRISHRNLPW